MSLPNPSIASYLFWRQTPLLDLLFLIPFPKNIEIGLEVPQGFLVIEVAVRRHFSLRSRFPVFRDVKSPLHLMAGGF